MLSHERVWAAIDALAARHSLSASGLAKRAGLDSTAFNKSKRASADGRPRWPSADSLAKIIDEIHSTLDEFLGLVEGQRAEKGRSAPEHTSAVPLIGFAQAGAGGFFDDAGFPAGQGWDLIELPTRTTENSFALCRTAEDHAAALPQWRRIDRGAKRYGAQGRPRRGQDTLGRGHGQGAGATYVGRDRTAFDQSRTSRTAISPWGKSSGWRASSGPVSERMGQH